MDPPSARNRSAPASSPLPCLAERFRDLLVNLTAMAAEEPVSLALGKVLDRSGYLQDLRDERSEEAEGRIENLLELVSAAREHESRNPEPSLGGFVDQLSLLSPTSTKRPDPRTPGWSC